MLLPDLHGNTTLMTTRRVQSNREGFRYIKRKYVMTKRLRALHGRMSLNDVAKDELRIISELEKHSKQARPQTRKAKLCDQ